MSTRSSARNLFPPLDNPEITIRRRSRVDPTLLNDFEMATDGNGDPPVPDLQTMEELRQSTLNGRGGPIAPIAIQATNYGLKNDMIQQVQNSCQFYGLLGDDANKYLDKFLHVTQSIKVNGVTDDALRLYLFPHSLTHHTTAWFDHLTRSSINTFEQMAKMFLGKYLPPSMVTKLRNEITNFHTLYNGVTLRHHDNINASAGRTFMKRRLEECYDLIENMTDHHNDWDTSAQWSESSSSITSSSDLKIIALKAEMAEINKNLMKVLQINQQVKAVTHNCETCGGPHSYNDCPATVGQTQSVYAAGANQGGNSYQPQGNRNLLSYRSDNYLGPLGFIQNQNRNNQNQNRNQGNNHPQGNNQGRNQFFQRASHGQNPPPAYQAPAYQAPGYQAPIHQPLIPQPNTITNPKEDLMGITTRSENAYQGPTIPTTSSSPQVVKRETEVTKDTVPPTNNGSTKYVQPPVVQIETLIPNSEPVSALKPNQKPSIPYPSRLHDQKHRDKANDQKEKFFQIFQNLNFNISFANALILMPKFGPAVKSLLTNKYKLYELARTPLNGHCSAVLLKELLEKLGDPSKFLIPCDFPRMDECLALTDLGASINFMPLSMWNKLSLPELSPTLMTLELADRSISQPISVAEDVFVKVGKFHFLAGFVVVDFDADPRVPLILERSFLKIRRALIDVYAGELTLRVNNDAVTFNLDQTSRYSANYNDMTANRIDVIDIACEEYSQEVIGFSDVIASGNPSPYYDLIISTSSSTLTPFRDSDFLLEEVDAFLALKDDPTSLEVDHSYYDMEGDILLLVAFLNDDPSLTPPTQGTYLPQIQKELKFVKLITINLQFMSLPRLNSRTYLLISNTHSWRENELIPTRLVTGWRVCIDYRKLNEATRKDHFPLPFMDQMLERLARNEYYCFLNGFSSYFQIPIDPKDQEKTTFTCPYGTFAYHRMPFGLCNAPSTFQRCMMAIFHDMIEKTMEVFIDDFSVFENSFGTCLSHLEKMLKRCKDTNLCLNWEKSYFMVKEGIVLGHKISKNRIKVDKAKVNVIAKLPHPTTIKGVQSFLEHAEKITEASILIASDWDLPFELMCDASDFAIGAVLGKCHEKHFRPIHYASKTMTEEAVEILKACHNGPGDTMAQTTPPKRCLTLDFTSPQSIMMPMTWSNLVTLVNVREKFHNGMKCLKIPTKFARFSTFGVSISWGRSRLHEGTIIYSWPSITCRNGSKPKCSPPTTPELFAKF
nr:reverse transcriptase domain-containing protein [Tanacetum cinerariifolium]